MLLIKAEILLILSKKKKKCFSESKLDFNSIVHLNNFIFLVFSYCTHYIHDPTECPLDQSQRDFMYWLLYGNLIVYGIIFIFAILYNLEILDFFTKKCGAVCITLNALGFAGGVIIFDILSFFYAIKIYFFGKKSTCKEMELFTMVCAIIFLIWLVVGLMKLVIFLL